MSAPRRDPAQQREAVRDWNARYPDGVRVRYISPEGHLVTRRTRSRAMMSGDGRAVVWLSRVSGAFNIDDLEPIS